MTFLKEEHGGLLKEHWNLVIEKRSKETLSLMSPWTCALVDASESSRPLAVGQNFGNDITRYLLGCCTIAGSLLFNLGAAQ
jgi:hypothetical protein